jgi:large subunit ribosomal protein L9
MKIILTAEVSKLGSIGDIVNVKDGYARNFLLPRGLASVANDSNKKALDHQVRILEKKRAKALDEAKGVASNIEKTSVTVSKQVGEDEKIFGTVTTAELSVLLKAEGLEIDKKDIKITEEIKKVGVYAAEVKLHAKVTATFKVWVVAQTA